MPLEYPIGVDQPGMVETAMVFKVSAGKEFPVARADDVANAQDFRAISEERTRTVLVYVIVGLMTLFLVGAAVLGVFKGDFSNLQRVWNVTAPVLGAIVGYYLTGNRTGFG